MAQNQEKTDIFTIKETGKATNEEINQYMNKQLDSLLEENIGKVGEVNVTKISNKVKKCLWEEYKNNIQNNIKPKEYKIVPAGIYAKGVAIIKKIDQEPFSHEQNVEARVLDYKAKGDNSELFDTYLDSITGAAYKKNSTKFKIKPVCNELIKIKPEFNRAFKPVDYDSFKGEEFDSKDPNVKYNQSLTREEAKVHSGHLAAMNNNKELWEKYVDLWFDKTGREKGMGFYVIKNPSEDQLRSVVLSYVNLSDVCANYGLYYLARFVSGAQ